MGPHHSRETQGMSSPSVSQSPPTSALSILNRHPQRIPGPVLLHQLVKDHSSHRLPAIDYQASDGSHKSISYPELHAHAEILSRRILASLPDLQNQEQLVVPLLLPQCPELYISQLAILKAGGAFCPLNLDAPPERVRFILGDVSAKVVITSHTLRAKIDALDLGVAVVIVDEDHVRDYKEDDGALSLGAKPDSLAYVMYTSGSTGTPKGVGISHDAATQALLAHDRHIPPFERFLQFAAPTFDVSVFEIFFPFFRGVTLVSCNREAMLNDLPAVLRNLKIDACELTPTVAGSLLRSRDNAPSLRLLLTIGEMLTEPVIREFGGNADMPSILWAMYGPTEATIHCTLQPSCKASSSSHNVGFPLDTASAFILEPLGDDGSGDFKVLPLGDMGELAVGGHQTAIGYINRPDQTAKVFVDTPYGRLYRTGDKARIRDDGTIECFGRISDGQVKLRGQRIELGEIEQAILRAPGCRGAVASVIQGIIVVFCERDDSDPDSTEDILQTCRDWLPAYMVPGDIIPMEAFPRLPSGKVDRKQLKSQYENSRSNANGSPQDYKDDVERQLAQLAEAALGIQLDSSSILSASGVDSLAAIKLASHLRQSGYDVGAIDVLNSKTLSQLRLQVRKVNKEEVEGDNKLAQTDISEVDLEELSQIVSSLGLKTDDIESVVHCAPVQLSMLSETLRNPEAYCNWIELRVPIKYAVETISSWFQDLSYHNEALRTGFIILRGEFRQVVWKQVSPTQIRTVKRLDRRYRLEEKELTRPFSVQILENRPHQYSTVLIQIHHALYDGWSSDILLSELNLAARGAKVGKRPPFRLVSNYYRSDSFFHCSDAARDYWAEYLLGFQPTPMPQLLAKKTRQGQILSAHKTMSVDASALREVSLHLDVSVQVLFQTCLMWLWGSILGTEDIVIGNVTSGRTIPLSGIEDVVGPCLTTIPLRARMGQVQTVKELLESIHASNRESLAHCTLPLKEIKKAAGIAPGQPLYDALFVYQESIPSRLGRQQTEEVQVVAHEDYLETKLLVEIEPMESRFQLRVTYHADIFHYGYMQLLLRQFECILNHFVKNFDADVTSITSCFSENLLSTYNRLPGTLDGCTDLATLFETSVSERPDKPAICFAHYISDEGADLETISYSELNKLSNQIAAHLRVLGASEHHPVGIIMEKSIMLYAGILGILKAGCAYLPLLPSTPTARVETILRQANVQLCISDSISNKNNLGLDTCNFVSLRDIDLSIYNDQNLGTISDPSRIANIIYTSGSTGVPKGVCVTQLNICSNLDVLSRIYPVNENSRMLQACSQAFDVSVFEILFALTRGMCLCAATNDTLFADLERSICVMETTHLSMTPTVASLVDPKNVPKVEFLVTSGEPMTSEVARKWVGKLYQGYGPSETTNICSVKKMTSQDHIRHLGYSFENTSAFVLSPKGLDIMPIGCVGELCFGGDQVVAGYLNLPDVTREKFIEHPMYGRIYRSGDVGRMLADGSLLIVGRVDDQIKLRGQRIELGEINVAVASASEVSNCVTMLVGSGSSRQVACFYVPVTIESNKTRVLPPSGETAQTNESIYHTIRSQLPNYMVPSYLIPLSVVPMTSSGKVDKTQMGRIFANLGPEELQAFSADAEAGDSDGDWSEQELKLAKILAEVLKVSLQDIGRWTPLTSLGLDSISAIAVAKSVQKHFSRKLLISTILQNTSVARIGELLSNQKDEAVSDGTQRNILSSELIEAIRQQIKDKDLEVINVFPCTPLQEGMLASSTSEASYLNKMLLRLNSNVADMKRYWSFMFQRHDILRTCFFTTNDRKNAIVQVILKQWEPEFLSFSMTDSTLEDTIGKHAKEVPAAINSGSPPVSLAIIEKGGYTYLSFICHHAMYDGVAISRLLEEIEYFASGTELPPAPPYEPFLREMLALPESTDDFWKLHLAGIKPKSLPLSSELTTGHHSVTHFLPIPYSDIESSLKTLNVSLLSALQASWSTLLRIILQSDDVCFGNVVNGRTGTVENLEELVAPCFNTIPIRIDFQDKRRNINIIKYFQSLNPDLLQYQFTPLRRIQALCSSTGSKLFDSLLLLQQTPRSLDDRLWSLERDEGEMDVPIVCEVTPVPQLDSLEVKIHFDRSLVSDAFATLVHDILSHIFSTFLRYPSSSSISRTSLPSALQDRLDRLALVYPVDKLEQDSLQIGAVEGWGKTEEAIRSVLSKISKVHADKISHHTTIFQLGLDSINAVQVAIMLREDGFPNVTATDVLENPTCSKLTSKINNFHPTKDDVPLYDIVGFQEVVKDALKLSAPTWDAVEAIVPCTSLQMGILSEFINSQGKDYFNFISFRVDEEVSALTLRDAWMQVTQTHEILRTGFTPLDHKDASFAILQYKFQEDSVPVSIQNNVDGFSITTWKQEAARHAFDNLQQPPWQVVIVDGVENMDMHLAIHHGIYDAQSLQTLLYDLKRAVCGESLVQKTNITTVVQDIITQTNWATKHAKDFWEKQAPFAVINKFPVMTPLKEEKRDISAKSKTCSLSLAALEEAVRNADLTTQAVAQAAWLRILSSYLGESSVVFGTVLSGRNSDFTRDAVFPCIATLPVIAQSSSSNHEILQAMMKYNIELQRHQRTPLTDIQRWIGHPNTKLFDTLLVYQKFERDGESAAPWRVSDEQATVDYPISLEVEPGNGSIEFRVTFFSDVLPEKQAEILLQQFDVIFCDLAQHPSGNEDSLLNSHPELFAVLPAEEPELKSNVTLLHEFVETSAQIDPEKIALEFVACFENDQPISQKWTYKELDYNGNKVANMLSPHVKTGEIVAVCFDKSPEAHFAMLGILKAGCALLALDPGAPSSRKEFILQDSGAAALLTDKSRSLIIDLDVTVPIIVVDEESLQKASADQPKLTRSLTPDDRSYCLYTSGTTGTPKGCEITHENAVQALLAFQKLFEGHWDSNSRWLQFASYHFDVSVLEQYWTWSVGITLFAAPRDVILEDLAGTISRLQITHIDLTPSLARLLHPDEVPSLCRGVFITGGEQLKQEILDVWGPKRVIHNFYGPTEATIGVTTYPCVPINGKSSNIGRQFANVGSYVLQPGTEIPVLKGGVGELCVSGKLVGKGYLNRDNLTTERFPMLTTFNERVYRTGDLVRVLHDGCFDFLGRADDQVKLRGQRLEIGEINHCIKSGVPEVTDVVTLVVRNEKQQKDLLVSFVVATQNQKIDALQVVTGDEATIVSNKVQQACRNRLPGYMVPTYILLLSFIPLSSNNKAEVKQLRSLFNTLPPEQLVAPSSSSNTDLGEVGKLIFRALSNMSGIPEESISPSTSIFELGVDSISVMRFTRALKRGGLKSVTPAVILRNPTVADLAHALKSLRKLPQSSAGFPEAKQLVEACQHRHRGFVCRTLGVKPEDIEYIAPCSALQHGMISRSRTEENKGAYFNTFRFELAEDVSVSKLRSAWESLVSKHSILRTQFVSTTEGYIQVVQKDLVVPWEESKLKEDGDLDTSLRERLCAWVDRNSQSINQPLEFHTITTSERQLLVIHIFHGVYDANSFELMIDEVVRVYKGEDFTVNGPSFLDALLHGPLKNHTSSKNFWIDHLKNTSLFPMNQLSMSPSEQDLSISRQLPFDGLDKVRKTLGVTQQAIVQALWSTVLQQYYPSGATFGVILSGRTIELEDADRTIGPLFNTVPYHHQVSQGQTWSSVTRQCHEFNTAILPFQHIPLRDIQKWCSRGRPVFDTLFSFQRASTMTQSTHGLWKEVESNINPDYPLAFEATLTPNGTLEVLLVAQKGVADESVLSGLLDDFTTKAKIVVEDPDSLVTTASINVAINSQDQPGGLGLEIKTDGSPGIVTHFEWTPQAEIVRKEIALLSDIEESHVTEATTILELGLDSIDTIKLSARLRRAGISLSNSELIKSQKIANIIAVLKHKEAVKPAVADSGYSSDVDDSSTSLGKYLTENGTILSNVEQVLPPTPLQDSMVSEMINSDFRRYFNHDILELSPDIDVQLLKTAWMTVIKNSPILRTVFVEVDSPSFDFAYAQLILKETTLEFNEVEIRSLDETSSIMSQARERALEGRGRSNLLQITFVNLGQKRYIVLSISHALYDGWSLGLLHQDIETAYRGTYSPRQIYTEYLGEILRSSKRGARDFWSDYISGAAPTLFPSQEEVKEVVHRAEISLKISSSVLKTFCKRHAVSQQAVAQASWAAVLATHSQRLDVTFGTVLSGRETEASEAILFPTMNTIPVRAVFYGTVSTFLRYMQDNMINISQFQHFPLRKIQSLVQDRQGSLFNTLFILQKGREATSSGEPLMKSIEGSSAVEYPVCVEMEVVGEQLVWRAACNAGYMSLDETNQLLQELENVLNFLVSSSDQDVLEFSDNGVSICGLSVFQPQWSLPSEQETTIEAGEDDDVWSTTEETIRNTLAEMSGVDQTSINKNHNLYHLGLDSISAIKVSSALRKRGFAITVKDLIQATSIKDMAAKASKNSQPSLYKKEAKTFESSGVLAKSLEAIKVDELLMFAEIDGANVVEVLPATAMQTHVLSVWQNTKGTVFYPEFRYRLSGISDREVIDKAWETLVEQTSILRTIFLFTGSDTLPLVQVVLRPNSPVENPFVSLSVRQHEDSWIIRLRIHHALYDGVSLPLIISQFKALCSGSVPIEPQNEGSSTWKYLNSLPLDEEAVARRKSFWTDYFKGYNPSPPMMPDATTATATKNRHSVLRRAALGDTSSLKALCAQHGISLQALFLAAYAKVLASNPGDFSAGSKEQDVVFGVYLANRGTSTDTFAYYPTLCLVPLRVKVHPGSEIVQLAAVIQRDLHEISATDNISVGLWEIREWTGVVVDSFVNFLSLPDEPRDVTPSELNIQLENISAEEITATAMEEESAVMDPDTISWLQKNTVRDAYPDAVDIEASLQADKAMDIGVFANCDRLDNPGDLIQRIVDIMRI